MPPRFAYWTILVDGQPTAFRAAEVDELLPDVEAHAGQAARRRDEMVRARAAVAVARRGARPAATRATPSAPTAAWCRQTRRTGAARAGGPAANTAIRARNISWRRRPSGRSSSRWCGRARVTDPRPTTRRRPTTPRCPTTPHCPMTRRCPAIRHPAIRRLRNLRLPIGAAGRCRPAARRRSAPAVQRLVGPSRSGGTRAHAGRSRNGATAVRVPAARAPAAPDPMA